MNTPDPVDVESAHRKFAAECFNLSWALLDRPERTPDDEVTLVALAQTSLWHWMQRPDRTDKNLSIAHWLLARVYCVVRRPEEAARHAALSLDFAGRPGVAPFALAYAHEACARAAALRADRAAVREHVDQARALADRLDAGERTGLLDDLATIPPVTLPDPPR